MSDHLAAAQLLNPSNTTLPVRQWRVLSTQKVNGLLTAQAAGSLMYLPPVIVICLVTHEADHGFCARVSGEGSRITIGAGAHGVGFGAVSQAVGAA